MTSNPPHRTAAGATRGGAAAGPGRKPPRTGSARLARLPAKRRAMRFTSCCADRDAVPAAAQACAPSETLAAVYRAYRGPLLRQARTILGDPGLAEEVVQETFVRAWRACPSFDPDGSPMLVWLSVILRNLALDRMRARGRRPAWRGPFPTRRSSSPLARTASTCCCCGRACATRWPGLHDDHRTAVVETILLDRPYEDVAAELGVPVGTVRSRAYYALRRMRRILEAQGAPEL